MNLETFKKSLTGVEELIFTLPNGERVPSHFHVTEVGELSKRFIDCGGTLRFENKICFQLWKADDYDHRLQADKLRSIISLSEEKLQMGNHEIEVEYQGDTIGKYGLDFVNGKFLLTTLTTDCLAKDNCGVPQQKPKLILADIQNSPTNSCTPGGGCC